MAKKDRPPETNQPSAEDYPLHASFPSVECDKSRDAQDNAKAVDSLSHPVGPDHCGSENQSQIEDDTHHGCGYAREDSAEAAIAPQDFNVGAAQEYKEKAG